MIQCLQKLSNAEFLMFKELLRREMEEYEPTPVPWDLIMKASERDLIVLLTRNYLRYLWEVLSVLFVQVNRSDLWTMAQTLKIDNQNSYKEIMKITFQHIWSKETFVLMDNENYHISVEEQYKALQEVFHCPLEPVTTVVLGSKGKGKTTFLRKAMLDWASGNLWQNRFQYVFFISLITLNNITELSLAELMLAKLSESSETLDKILSDPKRILFILEGLEYLKFDLELRTNLCNDWGKTLPTQVVFSSLLQKVMLPESSLLLELGNPSVPKIYPLLRYPKKITIQGFTDETTKFYCMCFFSDYNKGLQVFRYLEKRKKLLTLCRNPYICWVSCSTLIWQWDRGEEMNLVGITDSIIYTSFLVSTFRSVYAKCPPDQNRAQLKTLCTLAAEAMWKQVFVFTSEDLRRNGITESEKAVWLQTKFLCIQGEDFMFYHPTLQSYFTAMFYFLRQDEDTPHPVIGSLPQLLREVYDHGQTIWLLTGIFMFGIATEKVTNMLEPHFDSIPSKDIKQEILKCFRSLSQAECSEKLMNPQCLFESLLDNQEESFETEVMDLFEEMTVDISNVDALLVATYGLLKSQKLKKLHLHIQHKVFSEIYDPEDAENNDVLSHCRKAIKYWRILCKIFRDLQVLDLDCCNFNETAIRCLCDSMYPSSKNPLTAFKLQSLSCSFMTNYGDGALFHALLLLPHLKSVNLYGTNLSNDAVENMCSVLKCPACRVEELLLGKCDISSEACGMIATSLIYRKVKHLSLVENPLKNKGVMLLCEILKHPSCVLETLMLSRCCLNFNACCHLYKALLCNKYLSLLDLGSNVLEDIGVNILCEALKDPKCTLQELWLSGCFLTSDCCGGISAVLTSNKNLKTLKLGKNNIEDTGIKRLCEALRNPNCKLQCLGLDMNDFKTDCCADLASALTTCKTLTSLNLDGITFDHDGLELLCEALSHKSCNLKVLGLDKSALTEESQMLLQAVGMKKNLDILHCPWVKEESERRGVRLVWNSTN
ncbi:NACHT, LRR and PYD domains-containing protein 9B-like isoform X2 [Peromyscus californicus insignis]|uniref:NACHT, LRR and PYD domains-containing protein 9B-like isoform X2 n=1 Tax=Peromyscus californicus insignis TaxID=564181 RepID=UPI0022A7DA14|nr:NACHT, LRR and PYD domains-containing protein 9B-like isoform X2 [Peromyscus californicus insignis]